MTRRPEYALSRIPDSRFSRMPDCARRRTPEVANSGCRLVAEYDLVPNSLMNVSRLSRIPDNANSA